MRVNILSLLTADYEFQTSYSNASKILFKRPQVLVFS